MALTLIRVTIPIREDGRGTMVYAGHDTQMNALQESEEHQICIMQCMTYGIYTLHTSFRSEQPPHVRLYARTSAAAPLSQLYHF